MALSYKILSIAGIDIELHVTFLAFIVGLLVFNPKMALLLLIVFFFVTAHELFHSFVAISKGIKVSKITLLPIGGMAVMNTADIKPIAEIQMSLAGPLFNFLMCYILLGVMSVVGLPLANAFDVIEKMEFSLPLIIYYSFYANLLLGTFNLLLPAFPLDGGRIFRALLALRLDYLKATRVARNVSLVIAAFMFMLAFLTSDLWLMIIAFFIGFGAVGEYQGLAMHESLRGMRVADVVSRDYIVVKPGDRVTSLLSDMMRFRDFSVVVSTKPLSVADARSVAELPERSRLGATFSDIAKKSPKFTVHSSVEKIVEFMNSSNVPLALVYDGSKVAGVVKRVDVERVRQLRQAFGNGFKSGKIKGY
ncbi:hypothetical protein H0N95_02530 [Candidatus Micrarchaeota archaeon]|nr:hypothetical protein [Candidatus Micrarchaeota archaeon]